MKKFILASSILSLTTAGTMFGIDSKTIETQVVSISNLSQEMIGDFFAFKSNLILECKEGDNFPFQIKLGGQFLELSSTDEKGQIKILKTCYIKCIEENFYFSDDLKTWKPFNDYFTGSLSVALNVDQMKHKVILEIELNKK